VALGVEFLLFLELALQGQEVSPELLIGLSNRLTRRSTGTGSEGVGTP